MATVAGDIAVRVGADTSGLTKGLNDADSKLQKFGASAGAAVGRMAALGAAAIAAGAAIGGALAAKGFAAVDMLDEMSEKAGTSAKSLQSLQMALGEAGIDSDKTQAAIQKLNVAIGDAQSGNAKAQETFDKLGLSVQELAGMDADQRFAAIADAVSQYGNAADRASISSDIFGQKVGPDLAAAFAQGGDAIRQASADLEAMGLAMSDIDAAQVANAMDAFGRAQMVVDGVANTLAVELAPLLEAVSKTFIEAGKSGGGFGSMVSAAVEGAIKAVAFLANAIDGIKRIFKAVADALVYGFAYIQETFLKMARVIMTTLDAIPGVDLTANVVALEEKIKSAQGVMSQAAMSMREQFEKPLAGDVFLQYAEQAKKASQEAAAATIAAREATQGGTGIVGESEEDKKAREKAAAKQLELQRQIEEELWQYSEAAARKEEIDRDNFEKELAALTERGMTKQQVLEQQLATEQELLQTAYENGFLSLEQKNARELEAMVWHQGEMTALDEAAAKERAETAKREAEAKKAILSQAFGGLTSLMNSESRKMFEIGKAASISQAIVSTYTGMAKALELGFPLGPIAAGAIALNGFAQVANIRKQKFGGGGGGGGAASAPTANVNAGNTPVSGGGNQTAAGPTQRTNVTLIGDTFSRESVIGLLNEAFRDGFTLNGAT